MESKQSDIKKQWETPLLISSDVNKETQGGAYSLNNGNDAWYLS